jgi:hypothetical protein
MITPAENYSKYKTYYREYYRLHKAKQNEYHQLYRLYYNKPPPKLTTEEQDIKIIKAPITIYFS